MYFQFREHNMDNWHLCKMSFFKSLYTLLWIKRNKNKNLHDFKVERVPRKKIIFEKKWGDNMSNENVYYAEDGTRFSSIIDRDYYNNKLKEKEEEEKQKKKRNNYYFL